MVNHLAPPGSAGCVRGVCDVLKALAITDQAFPDGERLSSDGVVREPGVRGRGSVSARDESALWQRRVYMQPRWLSGELVQEMVRADADEHGEE